MTRTYIIEREQKPTEEQLKEVEEAQKSPVVFGEDCEELSSAMMKAFRSAVKAQEKGLQQMIIIVMYRVEFTW